MIAFAEHTLHDDTILRSEWRLKHVGPDDDMPLRILMGNDWRKHRPFCEVILEHRYIRRGVEESWLPFDVFETEEKALGSLPGDCTAIDPRLQAMQAADRAAALERRAEDERRKALAEAKEEHARHVRARNDAFVKLQGSKTGKPIADAWNDYTRTHTSEAFKACFLADDKAQELYRAALDSETAPEKRKAIQAFLKYAPKLEPHGPVYQAPHWSHGPKT